jgi:hypothetical protein
MDSRKEAKKAKKGVRAFFAFFASFHTSRPYKNGTGSNVPFSTAEGSAPSQFCSTLV